MSVGQACPTGNGECRGPESAQGPGTPLPGSRPERAAANDAKRIAQIHDEVADQGGFGTEDMVKSAPYFGLENLHAADHFAAPVDLAQMGDGGEAFGGT